LDVLTNVITLIILLAIVSLFAWLTRRAWKARRAWVKWPGLVLAGLLTILFALVTLIFGKGMLDAYGPKPVAAVSLSIEKTPERIARGEHLATVMCALCHSTDGTLPLSGGPDFFKGGRMPLGTLYPPNITPGGKIQQLSDADIFRILRTGIEPGGRWTIMGAFPAHNLSDEDAQSVIAYLRSAPSVQKETPPVEYSPLFVLFAGAGVLPLNAPTSIEPVSAPPKAPTIAYGDYIKNWLDCKGCHGPTLSADGGTFSPPGAANLTQIVPKWSKADFFQAMRTGVDVTGHQIQEPMPWKQIGKLDDVELEALYQYLHALTPITHASK
jgi:mono/diheme cytochrome c family protein